MKYSLDRFIDAQAEYYERAFNEIKEWKKTSHWIWYIFPQLRGLGYSDLANYYGIEGLEEAKRYIENDCLRENLVNITKELLSLDGDIEYILGYPDNLKLQSSMTLFKYADPNESVYSEVLDKFYYGKEDQITKNKIKMKRF